MAAEGPMTADKHFKRKVRERSRRTGESYTAALRHLRRDTLREPVMRSDPTNQGDPVHWQRVEKPDFGYAAHVPPDWEEYPPDLKNSLFEAARFADPADRRHGVIVFRGMPRPGLSAAERAEWAQASLEAAGFGDFEITEAEVAGQPGARLDCVKRDAGRTWAVREYFRRPRRQSLRPGLRLLGARRGRRAVHPDSGAVRVPQ